MSTTATTASTGTSRRTSISLGQAARVFWRYPSPWLITATLVPALAVRVSLGGWRLADLLLGVGMLAIHPFVEWVTHVFLLHWRPKRLLGIQVDPVFARKHRAHHADPRDVPLVFIPLSTLVLLLTGSLAIALFAFPDSRLGMTYLSVLAAIGLGYEWTHYLVHSDYRPKTAVYRALWRNHRLHHYKNEHYWFTVTNPTADHVLRTSPDPSTVETSPTARNLLGAGTD